MVSRTDQGRTGCKASEQDRPLHWAEGKRLHSSWCTRPTPWCSRPTPGVPEAVPSLLEIRSPRKTTEGPHHRLHDMTLQTVSREFHRIGG